MNFLKAKLQLICYAPIDLKLADFYVRDGYDNGVNTPLTSAVEPIGESIIALTGMNIALPDPAVTTGVSVKFGTDETEYTVVTRTLGTGTDEVQTIEIEDGVTTGNFTLSYGGQTTNSIAHNAANTIVEAELEALSTIGLGNVSVSGSKPKWTVTFQGDLAALNVALLTGTTVDLSGGELTDVNVAETVAGVAGVDEIQTLTITGTPTGGDTIISYGGESSAAIPFDSTAAEVELYLESMDSIPQDEATCAGGPWPGTAITVTFSGTLGKQNLAMMTNVDSFTGGTSPILTITESTPGVLAVNEVNTVNINATTTGGTFTLTHDANESAPILYSASASVIVAALEALASIGSGDVAVTGGPGPGTDWVVTFQGSLAGSDETLTGTGTNLTGGSLTTVYVTEVTMGVASSETIQITITPVLVDPTTISGSVTFGGRRLTVKVGEGNLTFTENTPREYLKNRGLLDTVRNADQEPMDVAFDFVWEFLSAAAGSIIPTLKEAIKRTGPAATWVSTSEDACEPYCTNLEIYYDPACGGANTELVELKYFRQETLEHNISDAQISCTGKCNTTEAVETRGS